MCYHALFDRCCIVASANRLASKPSKAYFEFTEELLSAKEQYVFLDSLKDYLVQLLEDYEVIPDERDKV